MGVTNQTNTTEKIISFNNIFSIQTLYLEATVLHLFVLIQVHVGKGARKLYDPELCARTPQLLDLVLASNAQITATMFSY